MAAIKRIIQGSVASSCGFVLSLVVQIAFVPIYLNYWDVDTCAMWLLLQSAYSVVQILDNGHSRFLWNEFSRITLRRRSLIRRMLWSSVLAGGVLGGVQVLLAWVLTQESWLKLFLDPTEASSFAPISDLVFYYTVVWWVFGSVGGIVVTAVLPFGHFATTAWWGVATTTVTATSPILAIALGADLYGAGITQIASNAIVSIPQMLHMRNILWRERLWPIRPSYLFMVRNYLKSQAVTLQLALDFIRTHGSRLLIAPMTGTSPVAAYSYMRTGANLALTGLNSFIGPILPELMRYLENRNQEKTISCCALLWSALIIVILPLSVALQICIEPLFLWWTQNKIAYNALLFGMLTCSVVIYALSVPAMAIVQGNNLNFWRLSISVASSLGFLVTLALTVPKFGITATGFCLMFSETVSLLGLTFVSVQWLRRKGLLFPWRMFASLLAATVIMCTSTILIGVGIPQWKWVLVFSSLLWAAFIIDFWKQLPTTAQSATLVVLGKALSTRTC